MHTLHQKSVAILLSLLLGLLPLQGVFAAEASMNTQGSVANVSDMADMGHEQMPETAQACDQCEQDGCCNGDSCGIEHCASCALAAVLMDSAMVLPMPVKTDLMGLAPQTTSSTPSFLYRPPRV